MTALSSMDFIWFDQHFLLLQEFYEPHQHLFLCLLIWNPKFHLVRASLHQVMLPLLLAFWKIYFIASPIVVLLSFQYPLHISPLQWFLLWIISLPHTHMMTVMLKAKLLSMAQCCNQPFQLLLEFLLFCKNFCCIMLFFNSLHDALPSHGVKHTWGFHKVKLRKVELGSTLPASNSRQG
jgi:hypothetical protein